MSRNGQRMITHGGDTSLFHSMLALFPENNVGFYVSFNSVGGGMVAQAALSAFVDHYYPAPATVAPRPAPNVADNLARYAGDYRLNRIAYTSPGKLMGLAYGVSVTVAADSTLVLGTPLGTFRLAQVEPLVFRTVDGSETVVFREDARGNITHLFYSAIPSMPAERIAWYEAPTFNILLFVGATLLFLSTLVIWPIGAAIRRRLPAVATPMAARVARWLLIALSALNVAFIVGLVLSFLDLNAFAFGVPPLLQSVLLLSVPSAILTIAVIGLGVLACVQATGGSPVGCTSRSWRWPPPVLSGS